MEIGKLKIGTSQRPGLDVIDVTQIVFIILKLTKLIDWSWWLVLMPLWVSIFLVVVVLVLKDRFYGNY